MFRDGQGVAQDREEAIRLFRLAAAQGQASAIAALKRLGA
jgi:TPR repeat protein